MIGVGELVGGRGMTMVGHRSGNGPERGGWTGVRVRSLKPALQRTVWSYAHA